jgi:nicotinamide mononucleotide (NMN) deamidase PncC
VAETTTGGLVSAALLSVSGASKFFIGGATVYATKSRRTWAGWTDENLVNYKFVDWGGSYCCRLLIDCPA